MEKPSGFRSGRSYLATSILCSRMWPWAGNSPRGSAIAADGLLSHIVGFGHQVGSVHVGGVPERRQRGFLWVQLGPLGGLLISSGPSGSESGWRRHPWLRDWVESGLTMDLTVLDFFLMVVAVHLGHLITFRCDNQIFVCKLLISFHNPQWLCSLPGFFVLQDLRCSVLLMAEHMLGLNNNTADALPHFQEPDPGH